LFGVGHLVGLSVGMAQLVGMVTGWWVLLPILTQGGTGDAETLANTVFRADVRFFGAGVIAVAAIWTLIKHRGSGASAVSARRWRRAARGRAARRLRSKNRIYRSTGCSADRWR
jgi:uncharacterized oligopeptide transporter (OPT) family protein